MNSFLSYLKNNIVFFDGAMGTMLQRRGLPLGELPERLNLEQPELVTDIHREYVQAGADVVTANTFQAHGLKAGAESEALIQAGVACAKASGARFVALDVGPLGQMLEPLGTLRFEEATRLFADWMVAGAQAGADLILIETLSDPFEAKAAILAAKENTRLPVVCSLTFGEDGRTLMGCDPLAATVLLQGLGVDALGVNCSLGPEKLLPVVKTMLAHSRVPVIVQANAGLPEIRDGQSVYTLEAEEYAAGAADMVARGVRMIGGCCGTSPEHIRLIKQNCAGLAPVEMTPKRWSVCTSGTAAVVFDQTTVAIGERLNPTGKKKMQQALQNADDGVLIHEALRQVACGAQVLDVNVGLPGLDEPAVLARVVRQLQSVTPAPLQIDSSDPAALEAACRIYNGKPIINSVNGESESLAQVLPIAKKYGAMLVGLTLDEHGIPHTAGERLEIARRIRDAAREAGIPDEDLLIDCLTLTASAQQEAVKETLAAVRLVKTQLGLKTVLGVSNVSFGLPQRELLGASFLAAAFGAGLDAAILNPLSPRFAEVMDAWRVLHNEDQNAASYVEKYANKPDPLAPRATGGIPQQNPAEKSPRPVADGSALMEESKGSLPQGHREALTEIIERGLRGEAAAAVSALLQTTPPLDIIDQIFIPALDRVGKRFEAGEIFLPQLLLSAGAVQNGFAVISDRMANDGQARQSKGKILLATVKGDIHDIGKNMVKMLLQNYGYEVIDLGKDVEIETVVQTIREQQIKLAGLSALMTTTVKSMKDTIAAVQKAGLDCAFMVGGAVLNPEYTEYVGAQFYAKDAMESVKIAHAFFEKL